MKWYSDFWGARAYQAAGDVVAIVVVVLGVVLGVALHDAIAALKGIGANVTRSGTDFERTMSQIGSTLGGIPFIGAGIRSPFDAASGAGSTLADAGRNYQDVVERIAQLAGWTVAVLVVLVVLVGWVRPRLVGAVRRGIVARLARRDPDLELLAFRALANRPAGAVARVDPRAAARWREGDPATIRALAALELRASGIRLGSGGR